MMVNPKIQTANRRALAKIREGRRADTVITAEELPDFLRDHG